MTMSMMDQLPHLTSKIEAVTASGSGSVGTGFFFNFEVPGKGSLISLITNKHVLNGSTSITIYLSRHDSEGLPIFGDFNQWRLDSSEALWVGHPDPKVDLAAFPIGAALNEMVKQGRPPLFRSFDMSSIPDEAAVQSLLAVEDVLMIGYPTGLWDSKNNLPIIRRGITATPYPLDYAGRPEFMIDAACFPGSSGSPVLIANNGSYGAKDGSVIIGSRIFLLGVLWGGPQYTAEGTIEVRPVPTSMVPVSRSQIPTNLGFCVKSRLIRDLAAPLIKRFG